MSRDFNIGFLGWFIAIHTFEALFAFKLAWDKNLNLFSCLFWCLQTLVFGFTSFEVSKIEFYMTSTETSEAL